MASGPADYASLRAGRLGDLVIPEGGLESAEVLDMLAGWSARLLKAQGWGSWLAIEGREVVASLAIKAPVADGCVEIGYGVAHERRGRGVATEALRLVLAELRARGVAVVRAETAPDNPASARVLEKAGFQPDGTRTDPEDGPLHLWRLAL